LIILREPLIEINGREWRCKKHGREAEQGVCECIAGGSALVWDNISNEQ
jgi:hypothetical protein